MKESEKKALTDAMATFNTAVNAIVNGNDEMTKPSPSEEEKPSKKEIEFIRKMAKERPFSIIGCGVKPEEGVACDIKISKDCIDHMVTAYLEKYCHE